MNRASDDTLAAAPGQVVTVPRRVATIVPNFYPMGGLERLVLAQIEEYLAMGLQADLVLLDEPHDLSPLLPVGCRVVNLGVPRLRRAFRPLLSYLLKERPDAVHVTMWPLTSMVVLVHRLARLPGRLVVSDHNPLSIQYVRRGLAHRLLQRLSLALAYPFASARIAVSNAVAIDLAGLSGLPKKRFHVVHNAVAISPINPSNQAAAEAAWGGWGGPRVLTVGRLKAQKNHALLLRAFRHLRFSVDARLMILGTGELAVEIEALAHAQGLAEHVLMPGHVDDPSAYYRAAHLFVLSSDYEGFGNVLVEALGYGLPVVSTDCPGGPREILADGRFGRLVPVGDEAALANAMALALGERTDPKPLVARAAEFAPSVVTARYLELLFDPVSPAV